MATKFDGTKANRCLAPTTILKASNRSRGRPPAVVAKHFGALAAKVPRIVAATAFAAFGHWDDDAERLKKSTKVLFHFDF